MEYAFLTKKFIKRIMKLEGICKPEVYNTFFDTAIQMKKNGFEEAEIAEIIEKLYWAIEDNFN